MAIQKRHYIYIVKCKDNTYYTGYTVDIEKRIQTHNKGKGAKYTQTRRPVELLYSESFDSKREALQREYAIKQLTREQKTKLINQEVTT